VIDGVARVGLLGTLLTIIGVLFIITLVIAAYAVTLRALNGARERRRARYAEKWKDRLLLALADDEEAAALQRSVTESERLPFIGLTVQYARRMRGDQRETLGRLVRPFLGLVAERARSRSVEVRARAIQTLGILGLPEHGQLLMEALDDPSTLVAMVAARALAHRESPEYAQAVLARLHRFTGWDQRFLASMLASMGPGVAPALRDGLADMRADPRSRAVLADALQIQGDLAAGDVAADTLQTATDRDLLAAVLRLLRDVGRPEHAEAVRAHARSDDPVVRAHALHALGAVGGERDIPQLVDSMRDPSPWAALNAAKGVLAAGGTGVLTEMVGSGDQVGVLARQVLAGGVR
jgi:HEAT repeat protein